jgi:hypothetical protein
MTLMTIDPGNNTGVAEFRNGILLNCGLFKCIDTRQYTKDLFRLMDLAKPDQVVIEIPRIYSMANQKGDPNDLIGLAKQVGICIAAASPFCLVEEIYPQQWKGQRPKKVDNKYVESLLHKPIETDILGCLKVTKDERHNILDAIGIGLWKLGRR